MELKKGINNMCFTGEELIRGLNKLSDFMINLDRIQIFQQDKKCYKKLYGDLINCVEHYN